MPTVACYAAQVAIMALTMVFAVRALRAGSAVIGGWLVALFITIAVAWDCTYTVQVRGDGNTIIGTCCGGGDG